MKTLKWHQVNAWRLQQHDLSEHAQNRNMVEAITQVGGIQAQVMSAAEMAIGTRVDGITSQDVQTALWRDRTLIKTWVMRAALHLIPAKELPLFVAARKLTDIQNWPYYFNYYGIDRPTLERYLEIGPEILTSQPMKREEFAMAVSEQLKSPELRDLLLTKGWGTPLKPLAWCGELCFGPSQGQNVTFVRPRAWIGEWQPLEPYAALQEILRRYLHAFGPATVEDFVLWWGARIAPTRKLFKSLEDELELVEVEGWPAYALQKTIGPMQDLEPAGTINLLPLFDAYTMGIGRGKEIEPLISQSFQKQVYRPQGWISAVVLVDGYIKGIWEFKKQPTQATINVTLFEPATPLIRDGIAAEAEHLAKFLNMKVLIEYKSE